MGNVIELAASKRDPFRFPITFTVSPTAQIVLYYYLSRYNLFFCNTLRRLLCGKKQTATRFFSWIMLNDIDTDCYKCRRAQNVWRCWKLWLEMLDDTVWKMGQGHGRSFTHSKKIDHEIQSWTWFTIGIKSKCMI